MLVVAGYYTRDESACSTLKLARPAGIEPATTSLEGWCSIQLSYGRWRNARHYIPSDPCMQLSKLVGVEGFEPPTPCSQSRCATRLRYTPIGASRQEPPARVVTGKTLHWRLTRTARGGNYTHHPRDRQSGVAVIIGHKCRHCAWRTAGARAMMHPRIERAGPEKR